MEIQLFCLPNLDFISRPQHIEAETKRPPFFRRHFQLHIVNENDWFSIKISLNFVPKGQINNISALVQKMAWRRPGDKPLSEPMMGSLLVHICVTWPQWVNHWSYCLQICIFLQHCHCLGVPRIHLRLALTIYKLWSIGTQQQGNFLAIMANYYCVCSNDTSQSHGRVTGYAQKSMYQNEYWWHIFYTNLQ